MAGVADSVAGGGADGDAGGGGGAGGGGAGPDSYITTGYQVAIKKIVIVLKLVPVLLTSFLFEKKKIFLVCQKARGMPDSSQFLLKVEEVWIKQRKLSFKN